MVGNNIADVVACDPHVIDVIPSEYVSLPDVDESRFVGDISWEVSKLKAFLRMSYLFDDFNNHNEDRKAWLLQMREDYGQEFWDHAVLGNALKRGNFVQLNGGYTPIIDFLVEKYCDSGKDSFKFLVNQAKREHLYIKEYTSLSDYSKMRCVRRLKARIHAVLKFCEKKKVLQEAAA